MSLWYDPCFVQMTWARHGEPMTRAWTTNLIERAESLGIQALIFGVQLGGHVAARVNVAPPVPDMEGDTLGQLCREGHARSIKIVPYFMSTTGGTFLQAREHPDWQITSADGRHGFALCYSSPFGDWMETLIRELLTSYPLDGLMFDQLSVACFCQFCRENFRRQYGREMPAEKFIAGKDGWVNTRDWFGEQAAPDVRLSHPHGAVLLRQNPAGDKPNASGYSLRTELTIRAGSGRLRRVRGRVLARTAPRRVAGLAAGAAFGRHPRRRLNGDVRSPSTRLQRKNQSGPTWTTLSSTRLTHAELSTHI